MKSVIISLDYGTTTTVEVAHEGGLFVLTTSRKPLVAGMPPVVSKPYATKSRVEAVYFAKRRIARLMGLA